MGFLDLFKGKKNVAAEQADTRFELKELKEHPEIVSNTERYALALAAPYRSLFIYTPENEYSPHMYALGMLGERDKKELAKAMKSSCNIVDAESMLVLMDDEETEYEDESTMTFAVSIQLHQILACVELGYIKWEDYEEKIDGMLKNVMCCYKSWQEYAENFIKGYDSSGLSRPEDKIKIIKSLKWLLKSEYSPWSGLDWKEK